MASLLAKIQIHPGKEAEFESVMAFMYEQTHTTESDVLRYEYWRGREPGFYYCLLTFSDSVAFWRHQASDHHEGEMARFVACIAQLDLEVLDAVQGASPLPMTQEVSCPASESAFVQEQAQAFPVGLEQWWVALRSATPG